VVLAPPNVVCVALQKEWFLFLVSAVPNGLSGLDTRDRRDDISRLLLVRAEAHVNVDVL
jgi:hypothetical protein